MEAARLPGRGETLTPVPQGHGGMGIDTTPLGPELYADLEAGVCVLELFGGIGPRPTCWKMAQCSSALMLAIPLRLTSS